MADGRRPRTSVDADGVRTTRTPGIRPGVWAAIAAGVLFALAMFVVRPPGSSPMDDERPFRERPPAAHTGERDGNAGRRIARAPTDGGAGARAGKLPPARAAEADEADGLPEDGSDTQGEIDPETPYGDGAVGIAAFPPPGTEPLKRGVVVPEDFVLPEGFMRHYQTTDDGKELRAILMFHPDYQPVDEDGVAIAIPQDRVVPPEMAPAGLEIEILDDPEPEIPYVEEAPGTD